MYFIDYSMEHGNGIDDKEAELKVVPEKFDIDTLYG
jgi:hypothetical protein